MALRIVLTCHVFILCVWAFSCCRLRPRWTHSRKQMRFSLPRSQQKLEKPLEAAATVAVVVITKVLRP
jgi:hypothetical protein